MRENKCVLYLRVQRLVDVDAVVFALFDWFISPFPDKAGGRVGVYRTS